MPKQDFLPSRIGTNSSGRPMYMGTDYYGFGGHPYSERTVTLPYGNQWVSFPSVDQQGNLLNEDQIMQYLQQNGPIDPITGEQFPLFGSIGGAVDYAKKRSSTR